MPPVRKGARGKTKATLISVWVLMSVLLSIFLWSHHHMLMPQTTPAALTLLKDSNDCPYPYERHSVSDIQTGQVPYLFGGERRPNCRHCSSGATWSNFCRFDNTLPGNPACGADRKKWLIDGFLERGFHDILTITPCDLFPLVRGRTIWVVGDSQSLDMSKALQCFLHEFWDLKLHNATDSLPAVASTLNQLRSAVCSELVGSTRICYLRADQPNVVLDLVLPILSTAGTSRDCVILNVGLHFIPDYASEIGKIATAFSEQRLNLPQLLWMDTPPQHFLTEFGEYPRDLSKPPFSCWYIGKADNKDPLTLSKDHQLTTIDPKYQHVADGGWRNIIARPLMLSAGIPVLQIWNESTLLWNYHRDNGAGWECTHYCFPSAPQVWVYHLLRKLQDLNSV